MCHGSVLPPETKDGAQPCDVCQTFTGHLTGQRSPLEALSSSCDGTRDGVPVGNVPRVTRFLAGRCLLSRRTSRMFDLSSTRGQQRRFRSNIEGNSQQPRLLRAPRLPVRETLLGSGSDSEIWQLKPELGRRKRGPVSFPGAVCRRLST